MKLVAVGNALPRRPSSELVRHEFTCDRCGYGAVACLAPPRCPMCGASSWTRNEADPQVPRLPEEVE